MHMLCAQQGPSRRHPGTGCKPSPQQLEDRHRHARPGLVTKLSNRPCTDCSVALLGGNIWCSSQLGRRHLGHAGWPLCLAGPPHCLQTTLDPAHLSHPNAHRARAGQQGASLHSCPINMDPTSTPSEQPAMALLFNRFGVHSVPRLTWLYRW